METGQNGQHGQHAVYRAEEAIKHTQEHALIQHHQMVEKIAVLQILILQYRLAITSHVLVVIYQF